MKASKNIKCLLAFLFIILSANGYSQNTDPVAYLDFIGNEYKKMAEDMMSYTSAAAHGKSARKIDKRRTELLRQMREAERNIRTMKPFNGDHSLRDSIATYFRISGIVLNEDYAKILDMEDIAEQSYDAMEAYLLAKEKASEKVDQAHLVASRQYEEFARNNNITILANRSKLQQKMETANKVIKYHDIVYLLFFKSYKNEAYVLEAMSRQDVSALEQSINSLKESASDDLIKIGKINSFVGDNSLKVACQRMLNFYRQESISKFPVMVEYFLQKEKFDKIKAAFDSKRPHDRKQEDIDLYNKTVENMNNISNTVNKVNDELNKTRNSLLSNWNKASNTFMDNHTPKYN